jgi:hypothetical protein
MQATVDLHHPNIPSVYEVGEAQGHLYIAMEYLTGHTLRKLLEDQGVLPLEQAAPILRQISEALDRAHVQDVIHGDIRPGNVVLEEAEQSTRAMLVDFKLIKTMEGNPAFGPEETSLALPEYMAPEQVDPEIGVDVGPAADRYALGIVAYQMLTGQVPFPDDPLAALQAHEPVPSPLTLNPDLPPSVADALLKMLAPHPDDRLASARAFAVRLREAPVPESRIQQGQIRLAPLYRQMQAAVSKRNWGQTLTLGKRIEALDPYYRDVQQLIAQAEEQLRRRRKLISTWALGAAAVLLIGGGVLWGVNRQRQGVPVASGPTPTPTVESPTAVPTQAPTETVVPTPEPTQAPTATPTTEATEEPSPTLTPTPTTTPQAGRISARHYPVLTWDTNPVSIPYEDGSDHRFWFSLRQNSADTVEVEIVQYVLVNLTLGQSEVGVWPRAKSQWYTLPPGETVRDGFNIRTVHSHFLDPSVGEMREPGRYQLLLTFGRVIVGDEETNVGGQLRSLLINAYE